MNDGSQTSRESNRACPDESVLAHVLTGTTVADKCLTEHLDSCRDCQALLDRLSDESPLSEYRNHAIEKSSFSSYLEPAIRSGDLGSLGGIGIESQLGSGGMGVVFRGRDDRLNRHVAVKVLRHFDHPRDAARFQREVRAAGGLDHDHVVPVFSAGSARDGRPYLIMPLIDGDSLQQRIAAEPLSPREAARIVHDVAQGLAAAHAAGLIHRDVKPANVMLDAHTGRARLTDFGLARFSEDGTLTQGNVVCGTPEYMSPEQATDPESADSRSDVYALGVTLYHCLTGSPPFRGRPLDVLEQHRRDFPVPPSRLNRLVPRDLETICLKAMGREPARRYASASALAEDLSSFLDGRPIAARPVSPSAKVWLWCRRNPNLATAMAGLLLALTAGTTISTSLWLRSERKATESRDLATNLVDSRARTRQVVRQFQTRLLGAESLHWSMDQKLQSEMFDEVIRYLDDFSALEPALGMTTASVPDDLDELSSDYLQVAEAALETRRMPEVRLAASRAYDRLKRLTDTAHQPSQTNWLALNQAAQLLLRTARPSSVETRSVHLPVAEWQTVALTSAIQACTEAPKDPAANLARLQTELLAIVLENPEPAAGQHEKLVSLYAELSTLNSLWDNKAIALVTTGWQLARIDADPGVWLDRNAKAIEGLREELRIARRPLFDSDRLLGLNFWHRSRIAALANDQETVLTTLQAACKHLAAGLEYQVENRILRQEHAEALAALASHQVATGLMREADVNYDRVLKDYLRILEHDSVDMAARVRLIGHFIRYGELCSSMNEPIWAFKSFVTASQDCKLILGSFDEINRWGLRTQLWCQQRLVAIDIPPASQPPGRYAKTPTEGMTWLATTWPHLVPLAKEYLAQPPTVTPPAPPDLDGFGAFPIDPLLFPID